MTYNELLKQESWYEKCVEILHRDKYRCQKCGALGYHNNTYYECETADELDSFLKGILIKDDKPSVFIEKIKENNGLNDFFIISNRNDEIIDSLSVGGNYLYDLHITSNIRIPDFTLTLPTKTKGRIKRHKCKGSYFNKEEQAIKIMPELKLRFIKGRYFIFSDLCSDNYVVRIEIREIRETPIIIISICYHDCSILLYFDSENHTPKSLNVHHRYYINGKNPWEYDNDALITLCQDCHCLEHKYTHTPVYRDLYNKQVLRYTEICDRCGGSGYLPQYRHVEGGICFKCWGGKRRVSIRTRKMTRAIISLDRVNGKDNCAIRD